MVLPRKQWQSTYNNFSYSEGLKIWKAYMTLVVEGNFLGPRCQVRKIFG